MNNFGHYNYEDLIPIYNQNSGISPVASSMTSQDYNQTLVNSHDGFLRGNMFADLYEPWISEEPFPVAPQNERETLLNKYREYNFAMVDLSLYLDVHPEDTDKIRMYHQYKLRADQTKIEYERRFGPLTLDGEGLAVVPWSWLTPPWSWEGK